MSSGERPIGTAKGKQPNTKASCQPPPPAPLHVLGEAHRRAALVASFGLSLLERIQLLKIWVLPVLLLTAGAYLATE